MKTYLFAGLLAILTLYATALSTYSADAAPASETPRLVKAESPAPEKTANLGEMLNKGGPLMPALYALSFLAVCLIFYYLLSLRRELIVPTPLLNQIEEAVKKKDVLLLEEICLKNDAPLAKVVLSGIEVVKSPHATYEMIKDAMEDEGSRQAGTLWERIQYLQDIAIVSPLVGLLGTVIGMIISFGALQSEAMTPRPTLVAKGVAIAFTNTAAGLVIAIPAMLIYAFFRGRVKGIITELESRSSRISRMMLDIVKHK
ncbi:MAG TPA: MotA/TolQ/ExbB proton channel family protein [Lentisphaeria bacterium]|nr:MAG: hypothetical protein A2X45_22655 [Lentisphaerae bacterium GWF2_50_93]HCE45098.1 MotA/TolQ/ExbB proton channel family protein [Lentisphaeria bacterium]